MDRSAFIGGTIQHPEDKQYVTFIKSGKVQMLNGINVSRGENELILYTPQYDSDTNTNDSGIEVLVEMQQPDLITSGMATGYVREIRNGAGSTPIPFDHVVLSATGIGIGAAGTKLLNNVEIGDEIGISHKIKTYEAGCGSAQSTLEWDGAYASIGGAFYFLKDGAIESFTDDEGAKARHPRTAIALNDEFIYFIVVDGRDPAFSIGMTIEELAIFARDTLGAKWGIAEDGGGSSTMVVNGQVKNNTFCNNIFCSARIFLPLTIGGSPEAGGEPKSSAEQPSPQSPIPFPGSEDKNIVLTPAVERLVPNGLMMVVVEPMDKSLRYASDTGIRTLEETEVRLGPGTNYATIDSIPEGVDGNVVEHFLNGAFATTSYWWKVQLGDTIGWVEEQSLEEAGG
jgi:hypothetical protein